MAGRGMPPGLSRPLLQSLFDDLGVDESYDFIRSTGQASFIQQTLPPQFGDQFPQRGIVGLQLARLLFRQV